MCCEDHSGVFGIHLKGGGGVGRCTSRVFLKR